MNKREKFTKLVSNTTYEKFQRSSGLEHRIAKFKKALDHPSKSLKLLFLKLFNLSQEREVKTFFNKKINILLPDSNAIPIYFFGIIGGTEYKLIEFIIKNLEKEDIFFDVGANYGFYSLLAGEFLENDRIHLFEPNDKIFSLLKKTFVDRNIYLNNSALSDKNGYINFYDTSVCNHSGGSSILPKAKKKSELKRVRSITLGSYCKDSNTIPSFIKLDVEGAEYKVIKGGEKIFREFSPLISMEVHGGKKENEYSKSSINELRRLGYKSYKITREGELEHIVDPLKSVERADNFIFKK